MPSKRRICSRRALSHGIKANIVHAGCAGRRRLRCQFTRGRSCLSRSMTRRRPRAPRRARHPGTGAARQRHHRCEVAAAGRRRLRRLAARVVTMVRIDAVWLAAEPMDMRAGT